MLNVTCPLVGLPVVLSLVLPAALQGEPPLFPSARFRVGSTPRALVVTDLNGDGLLDVATADRGSDDVASVLGDGHGGFGPPAFFPVMDEPRRLAAGDLDEDGDVDLAVIGWKVGAGKLLVLFGDGQGAFAAALDLGPGGYDVRVADVDLDGHLDVVSVASTGDLVVRLGDGQGGFSTPSSYATGATSQWLALGHVDGDALLDAVTVAGKSLRVLSGLPGGAFAAPVVLPVTDSLDCVDLGDMNGDGALDLVASCYYPSTVVVVLGDGLGGFGAPASFPAFVGCGGVTVADADADGNLDALAWLTGGVGVLLGDGAGGLGPAAVYPAVPGALGVQLADVDRDGLGDLLFVSGSSSDTLGVLPGLGGGVFLVEENFHGGSHPTTVEALDLDQDGDLDLAVCSSGPFSGPFDEDVWLLAGDGAGGFDTLGYLTAGERPWDLVACDLSGDGRPDLAVANQDSQDFSVFLASDGSLGFAPGGSFPTASSPFELLAVDLNHDGRAEIVTLGLESDGTGYVALHRNLGAGNFQHAATGAAGLYAGGMRAGDLDADGRPDLVVACRGDAWNPGGLWVWFGVGDVALGTPALVDGGPQPIEVEVLDLSGDGALDLIAINHESNQPTQPDHVSVVLGDGHGGFAPPVSYPLWMHAWSLTRADVDGDGRSDVLASGDGALAVLRGDGVGHLGAPELFSPYSDGAPCVRDLDGDLRPDVVLAGYYLEGFTILFNRLDPPPPCSTQTTWCLAKPNSQGCLPRICSSGTPSLSGPDDFVVSAEGVLSHQVGILAWSFGGTTKPFFGGTLCLAAPAFRTPAQLSGGTPGVNDCGGAYAFAFTQAFMAATGLSAGSELFGQYWSRDPYLPPPHAVGLTDAIRFTILP